MNTPRFPPVPEPDDSGELPEVFSQLTGIDVIDGELMPRSSEPAGE